MIIGVCLLVISVPKEPELKNYCFARRLLAGAYIILAGVGLWEVLGNIEFDDQLSVMAFTLIAASFQSLLFTFSIITLINMQYVSMRRLWSNIIPVSVVIGALLVSLFVIPKYFYWAFYTAVMLYCLQLFYYIIAFVREYRRYRSRFDIFFAGNEYRRMLWTQNAFCIATCVGIAAVISLFMNTQIYIVFTVAYTVFYIYFSIKFISYVMLFHRIAPVVMPSPNNISNGNSIAEEHIRIAVGKWIGYKKFLNPDISLESLTQELNTNQTYLSRYINTEYGQNFRSWINSLRIKESMQLMKQDCSLSLPEIAEQIGIPSLSTFYRHFSAVTGMTPQEYRKQIIKKDNAD